MPRAKKTTGAEVSSPATEAKSKRAKTTTPIATEAPVQPEPAGRKRNATAQPAAVSHKHTVKKTSEPAEQPAKATPRPVAHDEIAKLAYAYWEARGRTGGSPEQDWLRAERELLVASQNR